jgi:hypothetical protein
MFLYNSLDIIPYKTFLKIASTGDFSLLSDTETNPEILVPIWEKLFKEHLEFESTPESKKEFRITIDVESLETEYKFILGACDCLEFAIDDELIEILRGKRYKLRTDTTENYYSDLGMIKRFAKGLKIKINSLRAQLPKDEESEESHSVQHEKLTIDDVMAGYTMILGYDFDYNTVTYTKFKAIKRQVNLKMKSVAEQNNTKK